jgi:hypothetical protein
MKIRVKLTPEEVAELQDSNLSSNARLMLTKVKRSSRQDLSCEPTEFSLCESMHDPPIEQPSTPLPRPKRSLSLKSLRIRSNSNNIYFDDDQSHTARIALTRSNSLKRILGRKNRYEDCIDGEKNTRHKSLSRGRKGKNKETATETLRHRDIASPKEANCTRNVIITSSKPKKPIMRKSNSCKSLQDEMLKESSLTKIKELDALLAASRSISRSNSGGATLPLSSLKTSRSPTVTLLRDGTMAPISRQRVERSKSTSVRAFKSTADVLEAYNKIMSEFENDTR